MKPKHFVVLLAAIMLCGCTPKMTTVRPAEVSELVVTRLADNAEVTLPSQRFDADMKDSLIFQLEEPYDKTGACSSDDAHTYNVRLFIGDKLDTEVIINSDGSVCRAENRYVASSNADRPVSISDWDALFADFSGDISSPVEAEPTRSDDFVAFRCAGTPENIPYEIDLSESVHCADALPWSYYISFIEDSREYIVWRDTPKGDAELLLCVTQTQETNGLLNSVEYEGGANESGGRYLYFTICEAQTFHRSLFVFDTETLYFNQMYPFPCSNMAVLENPTDDLEDMGWIVYENLLIPIELEKAREYTGGIIDLSEYIDDGLFYGIGDFGTHKFARLLPAQDTALQIESIVSQPETSAPEHRRAFRVDLVTREVSEND